MRASGKPPVNAELHLVRCSLLLARTNELSTNHQAAHCEFVAGEVGNLNPLCGTAHSSALIVARRYPYLIDARLERQLVAVNNSGTVGRSLDSSRRIYFD